MNKSVVINKSSLAIHGGQPVRQKVMPPRFAMGEDEEKLFSDVLNYYRSINKDPGYQGHFENIYCNNFSDFMGGGYADAVASGTASVYVAIASLNLPKGSHVLVSPITDPGCINPIILNGLVPKLVDTDEYSYNISANEVLKRIDENTNALLAVHAIGHACDIEKISQICSEHNIKLIEDCSQAHGAKYNGKLIGTFGDTAAFSTMFSKNVVSGPTGGMAYTKDEETYHSMLAHADKGKAIWRDDFDARDPGKYLFPSHNFNSNEFSCAFGNASLQKLPGTIKRRQYFYKNVYEAVNANSKVCQVYDYSDDTSPFIIPVFVDSEKLSCSKIEFAKSVLAEGIDLNPDYKQFAPGWRWLDQYVADDFDCPNAKLTINNSFCLYVNENYGDTEVEDTFNAIRKVEDFYLKNS